MRHEAAFVSETLQVFARAHTYGAPARGVVAASVHQPRRILVTRTAPFATSEAAHAFNP